MRPSPPPKQDQRGAMEPKRVTKGGQVGLNRAHEGPQGEQTGAKRAPMGGQGSERAQEGLKGVPQSELADGYTVPEGPEGGLKGKNLQKPSVFEHS